MTGTVYPNEIDGYAQLPLVIDGFSPVQADDVNRLRAATIAIERELGTNPRSLHDSVSSRLNSIEGVTNTISSLNISLDFFSGLMESPSNKEYKLTVNIPYDGYISYTSTVAAAGTASATFKINGVELGGGANEVSTTENVVEHTADNVFSIGDDLQLEISNNAEVADLAFTVVFYRTS